MEASTKQRNGIESSLTGSTVKTRDRYLALDGLRGVAAVSVILFHVRWTNHITDGEFFKHAYLAVDLFFILSGFVIYAGYSEKIFDRFALQRFILLRLFRLYPLHLAVLLALVVLEFAKLLALHFGVLSPEHKPFTDENSVAALGANIVLVHSLGILDQLSWNTPSWSISCEFVAYIAFSIGALLGLFRRRSLFIVGTMLASAGYATIALACGTLDITYDWGLVRCLSGFFFGMLVFKITASRLGERLNAQPLVAISGCEVALLSLLILVMLFASGGAIVLAIPLFVGTVAVFQLDRGPIAKILMSTPIQFIGRISYSIYMVHFFIIVLLSIILKRIIGIPMELDPVRQVPFIRIDLWTGDLLVAIVLILVIAVSAITYAGIEQPTRLFGRRVAANAFKRSSSLSSIRDYANDGS